VGRVVDWMAAQRQTPTKITGTFSDPNKRYAIAAVIHAAKSKDNRE
jgi:hypothetical protein